MARQRRSIATICEDAGLSHGLAFPESGEPPTVLEFLDRLAAQRQDESAVRFLAHALPKREAVWWGCLCSWLSCRIGPSPAAVAGLEAAVRWVVEPTEDNRQAAERRDLMPALRTSAGSLAMAAFWSGGSMSRPDLPVVPPPRILTANGVAHAVLLAAVEHEPMNHLDHYRQFLALGREVAARKNLWFKPEVCSATAHEELVPDLDELASVG